MPGKGSGQGCEGEGGVGRQAGEAGSVRDVPEGESGGEREAQGVCQTAREMVGHNIQSQEEGDGETGDRWRQAEMGDESKIGREIT